MKDGRDQYEALLELRNTPRNSHIRETTPLRELINNYQAEEPNMITSNESPKDTDLTHSVSIDNAPISAPSKCKPSASDHKQAELISRPKRITKEPAYLKDFVR